jgi:hypothetical protein
MSNRILSYRNLIGNLGQDTILLSTKKGEVGYRITKFQIISEDPGIDVAEHVVQIYTDEQTTVVGTIDFSETTLLGCAVVGNSTNITNSYNEGSIIFDSQIFNQDIYVTHKDNSTNAIPCNYYLELEVIKLDESQAMVATLKDIRNTS